MKIKILSSETNYQSISSGLTIVLLHGWGCSWEIWSQQIPTLSKKFNLIIPDLPAFGKSKITSDEIWNSANYVSWLNSFLNQTVKNKPFVLVGHSFGAKIAALYTQKYHSHNLKSLALVSASGLPVEIPTSHKAISKVVSLIPNEVKNMLGTKLKLKILGKLGLSTDNLNSTRLQKKILKKVVHEEISNELKKIKTDTLLIWGANDKETPPSMGIKMNSLIPNSKLETINKSGHFPFIEQKEKFNSILLNHISKTNE